MQEPYGAYTWYPVNDQPSDKALYDINVTVPSPWTGIANGRLVGTETEPTDSGGSATVTHWQLDEPASSLLAAAGSCSAGARPANIGRFATSERSTDAIDTPVPFCGG